MPQTIPSSKPPPPSTESYFLPSRFLTESDELRFDAGRYSPRLIAAIHTLRESGMRLERLADITDNVFIPPRFKRMYVEREHGVPFLQGGHIVPFQPADLKYLSLSTHNLDHWIIESGWILVTRSGTIGRAALCPGGWDGWAASEHILRIVPNEDKCPAGYLTSFLASPLGQVQLTANIYGAVVDELTEEQANGILVPLPENDGDRALVRSLDATMKKGMAMKSEAVKLVGASVEKVEARFRQSGKR